MFVFTFFILPSAQKVAILSDIFLSKNMFSSLLNGLHVAAVESCFSLLQEAGLSNNSLLTLR